MMELCLLSHHYCIYPDYLLPAQIIETFASHCIAYLNDEDVESNC